MPLTQHPVSVTRPWMHSLTTPDVRSRTSIGAANHTLSHDIPWNILKWLVRIAGPFPRHLQHPFADDVPLDLIGTASDRGSWHRHQDLRQQPVHRGVIA